MRKPDDIDRAQQIVDIVNLKQRGHSEFGGENLKVDDVTLGEYFTNQKNRVGTSRARLPHLIHVHDEVLAQHGQLHRIANHVDVLEAAAKVELIRETGNRACTVCRVGLRDGDRIEVLTDHTSRWALPFYLGNDVCDVWVSAIDDRSEEIPRSAEFSDAFLEHLKRYHLTGALDLTDFSRDDVLQDRLHRRMRVCTVPDSRWATMPFISAPSIDIPGILLQSGSPTSPNPLATAAVMAAALAAVTVIGRRRLLQCPTAASGRIPADTAIGVLAWIGFYLVGALGIVVADAIIAGSPSMDIDYARLLRGAAGNLTQAIAALLMMRSQLFVSGNRLPMSADRAILSGVVGFLLVAPIVAGVAIVISLAMTALGNPPVPEVTHETLAILRDRRELLFTTLTLAHVVVLVPVAEEIGYRALLQGAIRRAGLGGVAAAAGTSAIFTLMHWSVLAPEGRVAGLAMLFLLGMALGILRDRTGGLLAPILLHALFNAANVAIALG